MFSNVVPNVSLYYDFLKVDPIISLYYDLLGGDSLSKHLPMPYTQYFLSFNMGSFYMYNVSLA